MRWILAIAFVLFSQAALAGPTPLPEVTIEVGDASGRGSARVPIYVHRDQVDPDYQIVGLLVDLEWTPGLIIKDMSLGEAYDPFGTYSHITVNLNWIGNCQDNVGEEGTGARAISLGYAPGVGMTPGQPAMYLFVDGPPGEYEIHRTCWHRGDTMEYRMGTRYYTFAGDVVMVDDDGEGWDILDEYPQTGTINWIAGTVTLLPRRPLLVEEKTWSALKALYR